MIAEATDAGDTSVPLLEDTIGANLAQTAARFGASDALIVPFQDVRLSYAELLTEVERLARGLLAVGIEPGDRVGMWSPNNAEWVLVQYATAQVGIILVNLNPAYRTHEVQYALEQSGCRMLIAAAEHKTSNYRAMVEEVAPSLAALEQVVYLGTPDWTDLLDAATRVDDAVYAGRVAAVRSDDAINIQYTSGTTGFPKGATLSHRNILNNGFFTGEGCDYDETDRVCVPVPFYHCFGMVLGNLACTTHGAAIVVPAPAFDPAATLQTVQDERCTSLYGVPTMFIAELELADFESYDLSSLRTGIMAGSPCPVEVMKQCVERMHMHEVTICYGMTETSPVSTQTGGDDPIDKRVATVGRVHPHVEIGIVDPDGGGLLGCDETGELVTRGYSVMLGYWNDPERTAEAIDGDGWMHTGDLAVMDDEGYVNIVGRIKDMVIRGGENVYPREIEEFLFTHPDIVDAQVIGVPDVKYGEEIMAWVRLREGATLSREELVEFCRGKIAHYKVPRYLHVTEDFPMTVTGKVQKFVMREASIELLGLEGAAGTRTA